VLEYGCATGLMTERLLNAGAIVDCLDRSSQYLDTLKSKGLSVRRIVLGDAEGYETDRCYDHVVATALLANLEEPAEFLKRIRTQLAPHGKLHVTVANPQSLHRLLAVEMGLIRNVSEPSERDKLLRARTIDLDALLTMAETAGLACHHQGGVLLKPFPNAMMTQFPDSMIEGLDRLATLFPEFASVHYLIFANSASTQVSSSGTRRRFRDVSTASS